MFDAAALNMRDDFARDLVRHEAEQGRVWRRQVLNTTVGNATGALIAGTDGNDAGYAAKARAALLTDGLGQGLSGEALDKQTNFAFGRRVVEPVVTARLSQGDVTGAKTFFYTHRDGMAGDDADILDRRLAEAGQAWNTKTIVDDLWQRLGPKSFDDPIDMDAIENDLVVRHGGDERALMRERDEVFHRILGFTQARDDTHAGYANFLINKVKGGASPSQIATLPQFLALPKDQQQQLIDWHREQMTDRLAGFAPDQNLDRMVRQFAAYHDLSGNDALKQMSVPRVQALEPVLGEDLTKQALANKQASPSLDATDFAALARSIGVDPNPAPSDTLTKAQLGVLRSAADKAIATSGTALTPQQQRETALGAAQTAISGHPLFKLPPEVQRVLDITPQDILGPTTSALSPERWSPPPEHAPQPTRGPGAPAAQPVRPSPAPPKPSLPSPSEDPVIRQADEKAKQLGKVAEGWARATDLAKDAAKSAGKWIIRRAPVIGTVAGLAAPNEIGSEVSTYLFGRDASDTNLRLSGRSDDLSRVVQIRRQGLFGPTWETVAKTEPDKRGHGSYRIIDPAAFANKTGLDWDTIVLQSTGDKPEDKVGFGVAVNNDEERAILHDGIANRDSATNIQRRIDRARQVSGGTTSESKQSSGSQAVVVSAEGRIGDKIFRDVNQTARSNADAAQPTLIAGHISAKKLKPGKSFPNGNMATAHAEIGVIHQAFEAGSTQGQDMTLTVKGRAVCGYCRGDIAAAAHYAGLKSLTIYEEKTGHVLYWEPGMRSVKEKKSQ